MVEPQSLGIKHAFFLETISERLSLPLNNRVSFRSPQLVSSLYSCWRCSWPTTPGLAAPFTRWAATSNRRA